MPRAFLFVCFVGANDAGAAIGEGTSPSIGFLVRMAPRPPPPPPPKKRGGGRAVSVTQRAVPRAMPRHATRLGCCFVVAQEAC